MVIDGSDVKVILVCNNGILNRTVRFFLHIEVVISRITENPFCILIITNLCRYMFNSNIIYSWAGPSPPKIIFKFSASMS